MTQNKPRPQRASFSGERGRTARRRAAHAASFPPSPGRWSETGREPAFCSLCGEGISFSPCDWFFGNPLCPLTPQAPEDRHPWTPRSPTLVPRVQAHELPAPRDELLRFLCLGTSQRHRSCRRPSAPAQCTTHTPRALGEKALGGLVLHGQWPAFDSASFHEKVIQPQRWITSSHQSPGPDLITNPHKYNHKSPID